MLGKLICILLLATAMLAHDLPKFRKASNRDRLVYGMMLVPLLYLGILFVTAAEHGPNVDMVFNLLTEPATRFLRWLNPTPS